MISAIVACANSADGQYVIGRNGSIPWHLPEDLKWFRKHTEGHWLVMGRKTFESLPARPLKGRKTIVLTKNRAWQHDGVEVSHDFRDVVIRFLVAPEKLFVCGGTEIYGTMMPWCGSLYMTVIDHQVEGDALFPFSSEQVLRDFVPQFVESREKPVNDDVWTGKDWVKWRHTIYGRRISG